MVHSSLLMCVWGGLSEVADNPQEGSWSCLEHHSILQTLTLLRLFMLFLLGHFCVVFLIHYQPKFSLPPWIKGTSSLTLLKWLLFRPWLKILSTFLLQMSFVHRGLCSQLCLHWSLHIFILSCVLLQYPFIYIPLLVLFIESRIRQSRFHGSVRYQTILFPISLIFIF